MTEASNPNPPSQGAQNQEKTEKNQSTRTRIDWTLTWLMLVSLAITLGILVFLQLWRAEVQRGTAVDWAPDFLKYAGRDFYAILTAVLFLVVGLSVFGLIRGLFPELSAKADVLFIAVLLIPIITYLLLIGQISNLAAGGVTVQLNNPIGQSVSVGKRAVAEASGRGVGGAAATPEAVPQAQGFVRDPEPCVPVPDATESAPNVPVEFTVPRGNAPVAPVAQQMAPPHGQSQTQQQQVQPQAVQQQAVQQEVVQQQAVLQEVVQQDVSQQVTPAPTILPPTSAGPIYLLALELKCPYDPEPLSTRVAELAQSDSFKFVILVWGRDKLEASIPASAAIDLLEANADDFFDAIANDPDRLRDPAVFPGLEFFPVRETDTTLEALRRMQASNLDAMVIVDEAGNVAGLVTLDQVTASMLLELAAAGE